MALSVFISYRRDDAAAEARLLHGRLAHEFGAEHVFLDVVTLEPGTRWLQAIRLKGQSAGVCLAVIGPRWLSILAERAQTRFQDTSEDMVKLELELALSRGSGVEVIPVLVSGATMPAADALPRSLRALSETQSIELHHAQWDQDVQALVERLARTAMRGGQSSHEALAGQRQETAPPAGPLPEALPETRETVPALRTSPRVGDPESRALAPDGNHYESVIRYMVDQGTVVPLLGSRVTGTLPDAAEIALDLARNFGIDSSAHDLPRVAQQVYVSSGRPDLIRRLRQILAHEPVPSAVHRFLAGFPGRLEELQLPPRYQMIVTTNYDTTLERAFEEANEPYDLAIYMASGPDRGRFVHFPFDRAPEPITRPNRYANFPIDEYGELDRTVIVKIHGGLVPTQEAFGIKDNFVITEDHYINYLSRSPIESLVPVQILAKLTESHCLFLGYSMRDWSLRVFLNRIWKGEPLGSKSWAVLHDADALERDFSSHSQVDCYAASLDAYVTELESQMAARGLRR